MPEKLRGGYAMADAQSWANDIGTEIATGKYKTLAAGWLKSMTLSDYTSTAMVWATDSNAYVCTQVMPNGYTTLETGDLDGAYYTSNTPTIDLQIAKGMYKISQQSNDLKLIPHSWIPSRRMAQPNERRHRDQARS
jgi:hypothetical protein